MDYWFAAAKEKTKYPVLGATTVTPDKDSIRVTAVRLKANAA